MDSLTQAALGGVIAQVGFHKTLGRKAIAWGIALGTVPDLDVFAAKLSSNPLAMEIIHRGLTHSIFFCLVLALIFGIMQFAIHDGKYYKHNYARLDDKERFIKWVSLSFWVLITHPLLDLFTSYGTQLLAPLSDHRFALNAISIIDPLYTLLLIISLVIGLFDIRKSTSVSCIALFLSTAYLLQGLVEQHKALKIARDYATSKQLPTTRIEAFPTMMTIFARRLWVETPTAVYIGHVSTWNNKPATWVYLDKEKLSEKDNAVLQSQDKAVQEAIKTYDWFTDDISMTVSHKDFGICKLDGRYGLAPLPHFNVPTIPLGFFNLCIKDDKVIRNAPYWNASSTKEFTNFKKINYLFEILKHTFSK